MTEKGKKPDIKLVIVSKTDKKNKVDFVLGWENEDGRIGCTICKEIVSIQLADGRTIRPDRVWVNFYDNREDDRPASVVASEEVRQHRTDYGEEDAVPF